MKPEHDCHSYFECLSIAIAKMPFHRIEQVVEILVDAYENQRTVYLFGNGGSAALASHFACDLAKGTVNGSARRFHALALTDNVALMTAWANDCNYEDIFAEQLLNFIRPCDVAFAISGSGNSGNVLKAVKVARHAGATAVGLTGFEGGRLKNLCHACLVVPADNMQVIEDLHLCVTHCLFTCIRARIAPSVPVYSWMGAEALPKASGQ
jgi:D-sedoheptulose 7-phosphate isomerase